MRSDNYYANLERRPPKPDTSKVPDQIAEFLAKGGKIEQVPRGATKLGPITEHDAFKKQEKVKRFGEED
jgi:hypothetical protein